jgi:hypothetical protein
MQVRSTVDRAGVEWLHMSLRLLLWSLVLLLLLIAGWQFLRALRLGAASTPESRAESAPAPLADADSEEEDRGEEGDSGFDYAPRPSPLLPAGLAPVPDTFQLELELHHLRRELQRQQDLIVLQRAEIQGLQTEIGGLSKRVADRVQDQPATSPEYSDAMRFAEQGRSAEDIAAHCGISVAEAGLVLSLARTGGGSHER